jgi:hypothetical protein
MNFQNNLQATWISSRVDDKLSGPTVNSGFINRDLDREKVYGRRKVRVKERKRRREKKMSRRMGRKGVEMPEGKRSTESGD